MHACVCVCVCIYIYIYIYIYTHTHTCIQYLRINIHIYTIPIHIYTIPILIHMHMHIHIYHTHTHIVRIYISVRIHIFIDIQIVRYKDTYIDAKSTHIHRCYCFSQIDAVHCQNCLKSLSDERQMMEYAQSKKLMHPPSMTAPLVRTSTGKFILSLPLCLQVQNRNTGMHWRICIYLGMSM